MNILMNKDIFKNKKEWNLFSKNEMEQYEKNVFEYYRKNGFPFFSTDTKFRTSELNKLFSYDFSNVIDYDNKIIKQTMHGLSFSWSFMPHSWSIVCNELKTPIDVFNNDNEFKKVIKKRISFGDNISDNGIRKMLKLYSGTQSVSNFRPTAAAGIYHVFCKKGDVVWDMSSGFGGRLLGAALAGVNYIGTDPSSLTFDGLLSIKNEIKSYLKSNIDIMLIKKGSEDYIPEKESLDFAFTSPPYFNLEKYSNEESQSYLKFKTKDEWINGFLKETFKNCHYGLKQGKYMAINIANTKKFNNLEDLTILTAESVGFKLVDVWKLALSNSNMKNKKMAFKYEPIFIFQKM